ncbi:MAG: glutamate--tRNA ligase [Christensenellales bacterium]|jgi:glutamyl-tRNA synthetase
MEVRTRFAPSPTGYLHIGGLRTALYAWLFARQHGGKFILRLEDTDRERYVENADRIIYDTLNDTGLYYDEGPDVGGEYGPYIQSLRKEEGIYNKYAWQLVENRGAYPCFCTQQRLDEVRAEYEAKGLAFKYDRHCADIDPQVAKERVEAGEPYVIRQRIPDKGEIAYEDMVFGRISVDCSELDDGVLIKSDGMPTYNFANVVDDHLMKITHVIRGTEYLSTTPKYNLIYMGLKWDMPYYMHLPPVMRDARRKLSKRDGDAGYEDFIAKGYLKEAIINYIALLGWSPGDNREIMSLSELAEAFDVKNVSRAPAIFDPDKLTWMNAEYIRAMSEERFIAAALPFFDKVLPQDKYDYSLLTRILQPRLEIFSQIPEKLSFLEQLPDYDVSLFTHKKMKTNPQTALELLKLAKPKMEELEEYSETELHDALTQAAQEAGVKSGQMLFCVRIALAGVQVTPGGALEIGVLLGREESIRRLDMAILKLASGTAE